MSVEYGVELVEWQTFVALWNEHQDGEFFREAEELGADWLLPLGPCPHWVSSMDAAIDFSDAFKRLRAHLDEPQRERFEAFFLRFCLTDDREAFRPPRDLGEEIDEMLFFSTISPESARQLLEQWQHLDMTDLREAYDQSPPAGFYVDTFEDFSNYPRMWGDLLQSAVEKGAGIVITAA